MVFTDYVTFDQDLHQYRDIHGVVIESVTSHIKRHSQPFDADYWSERKALEKGVSKEEILKEWDDKRNAGIKMHFDISNYITDQANPLPEISEYLLNTLDNYIKDDNYRLYPELVVFSQEMHLAGTIDLLVHNLETNKMFVIDFKTDAKLRMIKLREMSFPYNNYFDCNYDHYRLQTRLYSEILQKFSYLCNPFDGQIWHIPKSKIYAVEKNLPFN